MKNSDETYENSRRNFIQKSLIGASTFAGLTVASTSHASVETQKDDFEPEVTNYLINCFIN